jgi:chromosome segregation ATPase
LERDLQRSRYQCDDIQRSIKRTPMFPMSSSSSAPTVVAKTKGLTIEKLQAQVNDRDCQIDELERKLYGNKNEQIVDANSEVIRLRTKLDHAERLVADYKEQLHAQTLKSSVDNSKSHLSELELEKMRVRLQKRIEELEPLPELLRQAEMKNQEFQTRILDQEKRLAEQSAFISELNSKVNLNTNKKQSLQILFFRHMFKLI